MIGTIDCHQHFWERSRGDYHWLTPEVGPIYDDFAPADLRPDLETCQIEHTVVVQAAESLEETRYLLSLADEENFIAGVVGWVAMDADSAVNDISTLAEHPKFKGIRPMLQDIDDPNWMLKPELAPAFEALIEGELTFDALVKPHQLESLLTLLQRYPDLKAVLDHAGKPAIASGDPGDWSERISNIADHTSAYCKFSGLVTEAGDNPGKASVAPSFEHLHQTFGANRLMWGSDWPVVKLKMEYVEWHSIATDIISTLSQQDQNSIMGQTAAEFYSLSFAR